LFPCAEAGEELVEEPPCVLVVEEATLATLAEPPPPQPAARSAKAATAKTEARISGREQRISFGSFQSRGEESRSRYGYSQRGAFA
jgi:hypothetical protein